MQGKKRASKIEILGLITIVLVFLISARIISLSITGYATWLTGTQSNPGFSCLYILEEGGSQGDGTYWIDPNGGDTSDAFQVYCNMTGGGWTLVVRANNQGDSSLNTQNAYNGVPMPSGSSAKISHTNIQALVDSSSFTNPVKMEFPEAGVSRYIWRECSWNSSANRNKCASWAVDTDILTHLTHCPLVSPTPENPLLNNGNGGEWASNAVPWPYQDGICALNGGFSTTANGCTAGNGDSFCSPSAWSAETGIGVTGRYKVNIWVQGYSSPVIYGTGTEDNDTSFNRDWVYVNVSVRQINESNITFALYNSTWSNITTNTTPIQRTINWTGLGEGNYSYNVTVYDFSGNVNVTKTRIITLDRTYPQISFAPNTPANRTNTSNNYVLVNVSVSDTNPTSSFIDWNRSLVGYWNFNTMNATNTTDFSTYGNNGTVNGATWTQSGNFGGAYDFDDSNNNYINVGNRSSLNPQEAITLEGWFKPSQVTPNPLQGLQLREIASTLTSVMEYSKNPDGSLKIYSTADSRGGALAFFVADREWLYGKKINFKYKYSTNYVDSRYFDIKVYDGNYNRTWDCFPNLDSVPWPIFGAGLLSSDSYYITGGGGSIQTDSTGVLDLTNGTQDEVSVFFYYWDGGVGWFSLDLYEINITTSADEQAMFYNLTPASETVTMEKTGTENDYGIYSTPQEPIGSSSKLIYKGDAYKLSFSDGGFFGGVNKSLNASASYAWHHVALTYNKSIMKLYLDGVEKNSMFHTEQISTNVNDVIIGENFSGIIDEVAVFNRAFSAQEINASYNSQQNALYRNFTSLVDGNYDYYAYTTDKAGNTNYTETRKITLDTTYPQISFGVNTQANDTHFNRDWVYMNVSANDTNEKNITFALYN